MPNNLVFNKVASELQMQMFGQNGGVTQAVAVDGSGNILTVGTVTVNGGTIDTVSALAAGSVTVIGGTIDALSAGTVTVNGGTIDTVSALAAGSVTVIGGTIDRILAGTVTVLGGTLSLIPAFFETNTATDVGTATLTALDQNTSTQQMYSFYVVNLSGTETLTAWLEISPVDTATYFVSDSSGTFTVAPNDMAVLVAKEFLQYTRLRLVATDTASVECYYNAQS